MISPITALGLAALYCAGFAFPLVRLQGAYLQGAIWEGIILPILVAFSLITLLAYLVGRSMAKLPNNTSKGYKRISRLFARLGLNLFLVLAIRSVIAAAGYNLDLIVLLIVPFNASLATIQAFKATVLLGVTGVLFVLLHRLAWPNGIQRLLRFASALGYSLAVLVVADARSLVNLNQVPLTTPTTAQANAPRRVVWVIFDELDYHLTLGKQAQSLNTNLPNFSWLAKNGISANQAYSPTDATISSIPSLLMGLQAINNTFLGPANQSLTTADGYTKKFNESNTVMGRLRERGLQYSVLGFYHPYCSIFINATKCETYPYQNTEWYAALTDWIPGPLLNPLLGGGIMERISVKQSDALLTFLGRTRDSLTYVHLNIPHLPGQYALKHFSLDRSHDVGIQYAANLKLADELLGKILQNLKQLSTQQEILLVVSSDHGFRAAKKSLDEARPVPWLAWRVNKQGNQTEQVGQALTQPISTVHTGALVEDFLNGTVSTQIQITDWWKNKPVFPRLSAPLKHIDD